MLRGTRVLINGEARKFSNTINKLRTTCIDLSYNETIFPSLWEEITFTNKLGREKESQMWTFPDKKGRPCCLVPEVTGMVQELWRNEWSKETSGPYKLFYAQRCYRYERPQAGRYREFTQFGVEILGGNRDEAVIEVKKTLRKCLDAVGADYTFVDAVKRGLAYYVEDGFEVECASLGAQKQIAGGGKYAEGCGFAIGVDRLILTL
jgi:histidyl-tRNA synthetase